MRIGFLTYGLDRHPTGIGRYSVELLGALAALPDAPELLLLTTERADPHGLWGRFERHALPGCRLLPALTTLGHGLLSVAIRRYDLTLVHDPNGVAPFLGPSLGAARVVTIHDALPYVHPETHSWLDNWRYRSILPATARRADAVLTDSEQSRGDLLRFLGLRPERVHMIPLAAEGRFQPIPSGAGRTKVLERYGIAWPYLLYLGGLNGRKNVAALLAAFARLSPRFPALRLVIGGRRMWKNSLMDAALARLELGERVQFTGYLRDEDLPAIYSAAACFVFPSRYEGFGLPPLEAMACGTPVVCSNSSSLPEVVGDAALTIDPDDVGALALAIERVLAEPGLADDLRARGLRRVRQFSWEQTARLTLDRYRQLLEPARIAPQEAL